jgi:hypothetical protein
MNENQPVLEFVREGRASLPTDVDARVMAALRLRARSTWGRERVLVPAVLLLGVLVLGGVAWRQRAHEPAASPSMPSAPQGPQGQGPPKPVAPAEFAGELFVFLDAATTFAGADFVAVINIHFPSGVLAKDGYQGTVLRVLQGDAALAGSKVWLRWNSKPPGRPNVRSCFDRVDLARPGAGSHGAAWLMALSRDGEHDGAPAFHSPFAFGLPATRTALAPPPAAGNSVTAHVRSELLAALGDSDGDVRAQSLAALCDWDGTAAATPGTDSPWRDPTIAKQMLAMATDRDDAVRERLGTSVPAFLGDQGKKVVERLLFDRCAAARRSALAGVQRFGKPEWFAELFGTQAGLWAELTFAPTFHEWDWKCEQKAQAEGITTRLGSFERQMRKGIPENDLIAAFGFRTLDDPAATMHLRELLTRTDARVRAAAATGLVQRGERGAFDALRALATGDDPVGAICALDGLRTVQRPESLDIVVVASHSSSPVVRAMAAASLRDLQGLGEHLVAARLREMEQDAHELVRLAARGGD